MGKLSMKFFCFGAIGFMGFLGRIKHAKMDVFAVHLDASPKTPFVVCRITDALQAVAVRIRLAVHVVLRVCGGSKVFNPVIVFDAVNMVNRGRQPSMMPKENNPMGGNWALFKQNDDVTVSKFATCSLTDFDAAVRAGFLFPDKTAFSRTVKQFADKFLRNSRIIFAHAVAPLCNGLGSNGAGLQSCTVAPIIASAIKNG
jgi:hypothetical protein